MIWSLALTAPNAEHIVADGLCQLGCTFHIFRHRKSVVRRGRVVERLLPIFPRYVFVPYDMRWDVRRTVRGVCGLVAFGSVEARVPGTEVERWQLRCDVNDILLMPLETKAPRFMLGDRVDIVGDGPLVGRSGIYQCTLDDRACILVECFGQQTSTWIAEDDLQAHEEQLAVPVKKKKRRYRRSRDKRVSQIVAAV